MDAAVAGSGVQVAVRIVRYANFDASVGRQSMDLDRASVMHHNGAIRVVSHIGPKTPVTRIPPLELIASSDEKRGTCTLKGTLGFSAHHHNASMFLFDCRGRRVIDLETITAPYDLDGRVPAAHFDLLFRPDFASKNPAIRKMMSMLKRMRVLSSQAILPDREKVTRRDRAGI